MPAPGWKNLGCDGLLPSKDGVPMITIRNARLDPDYAASERRTISIAGRAINTIGITGQRIERFARGGGAVDAVSGRVHSTPQKSFRHKPRAEQKSHTRPSPNAGMGWPAAVEFFTGLAGLQSLPGWWRRARTRRRRAGASESSPSRPRTGRGEGEGDRGGRSASRSGRRRPPGAQCT